MEKGFELDEDYVDVSDGEVHIDTPTDLINYAEKTYPDRMILEEMNEFERAKMAGKVELIYEMKALLKNSK